MIKKIAIADLKPGMEVVQLSSEMWQHLPYLYADPGIIESEEEVARLQELGYRQVFVAMENAPGLSDEERLDQLITGCAEVQQPKPRTPFNEAIHSAAITYEDAMGLAMRLVSDAKLGKKVDFTTAMETASSIVESALSNPDNPGLPDQTFQLRRLYLHPLHQCGPPLPWCLAITSACHGKN